MMLLRFVVVSSLEAEYNGLSFPEVFAMKLQVLSWKEKEDLHS